MLPCSSSGRNSVRGARFNYAETVFPLLGLLQGATSQAARLVVCETHSNGEGSKINHPNHFERYPTLLDTVKRRSGTFQWSDLTIVDYRAMSGVVRFSYSVRSVLHSSCQLSELNSLPRFAAFVLARHTVSQRTRCLHQQCGPLIGL